jgi:hypothetical protein
MGISDRANTRRLPFIVLLCALFGWCAAQGRPPAPARASGTIVVLVAGDGSLPVFDNAVLGLRARLLARGDPAGEIVSLSATHAKLRRHTAGVATLGRVLDSIAAMRPAPGQSCFVYATSHGGKDAGLWLSASRDFLTPQALDRALLAGCADAPTTVVVSACFSGAFALPPMTRPNRIVLTAARPDRTSFGCGAGRTYTVYDKCALAAFDQGGTWKAAYDSIKSCVAAEEEREQATPSEPQAWFGAQVADMALPVTPHLH